MNFDKTPFPYYGGKSDAAEHVWSALGDVDRMGKQQNRERLWLSPHCLGVKKTAQTSMFDIAR